MMRVCDYFDLIDFSDGVDLDKPIIQGNMMIIPARHVSLLQGHPLNPTNKPLLLDMCRLIFEGVQESAQRIYEYAGDPRHDGFRKPYVMAGQFTPDASSKNWHHFELEGVLNDPLAYVEWQIACESFCLEVEPANAKEVPDTRI